MSTTAIRSKEATTNARVGTVDMKLEVITIPISDIDRATKFYRRLGWRQDVTPPGSGVVQFTPPGSACSVHFGPNGRVSGPAPDHATYGSFATFSDPDGNSWLLQEITTRLPGRVDATETAFGSASDLASAFRRAEAAHGEHEKRTGQRDANWPEWYAAYMVAEQGGTELPT